MIVLGMDVPLVELAFASTIIIIIILLEMIIMALLTSKQLTFPIAFPTVFPRPFKISPKPAPLPIAKSKPLPAKSLPPKPTPPPPAVRPGKLKLEQELARVQEQLSRLPSYTPQQAVIKIELPQIRPEAGSDRQRHEQPVKAVNRLLQKISGGLSRPTRQEEARAYREVQRISQKGKSKTTAPQNELVRLEGELTQLERELEQERSSRKK